MSASRMTAPGASFDNGSNGFHALAAAGQHILNLVGEAARRAADRGRYAALPRRYLDDVGMTPAELPFSDVADLRNDPVTLAHSV